MKDFLKKIILEAGRIARDYQQQPASLQINKKAEKDLVTQADKAVEDYLVGQIKNAYPEHSLIGEETGQHEGSDWRWIIDPIDGTSSFAHGQWYYSVSIALEHQGELELAAVYAPAFNELFEAQKGCGATLNGEPIQVSQRSDLIDCILGTGFACLRSNLKHNNLPYFNHIMPHIRSVRRCGSSALDLCYVACGRLDGYWELNLNIYDVAGGMLILSEAGGITSDFNNGTENFLHQFVASNGVIHATLLGMLQQVQAEQNALQK